MALGDTVRLAAEVRDQNGRDMAGATVVWASDNAATATVNASGLVTAAGNGSTAVTATSGPAAGTASVSVMQSAGSVVVSPAADTVAQGDTLRLVAEAFDVNGHMVEGTRFIWSSIDVSVASVNAAGLVTGVAEGTGIITARAGNARGTSQITVVNPDREALVASYEATGGPNWIDSENWLTDAPLGEWFGVTTNRDGRVVVLAMETNQLTGSTPPELGDLGSLTQLFLGSNALTGPIPPELGNLADLTWLDLRSNELTGPIPRELAELNQLEHLQLDNNSLTGEIPPELGNLANLRGLDVHANELVGSIPPELGNLANLESLSLNLNGLRGPIPMSFLQLAGLQALSIEDTRLCVPGSSVFAAWLQGLQYHDTEASQWCNAADVAALRSLYEATDGSGWTESGGWLTDHVAEEWHGVAADSLGRVTELDLHGNGLAGRLPVALGDLTRMTILRIGDNEISGRLPSGLARLPLVEFEYAETGLCAPAEEAFRAWLNTLPSHAGTGVECAPLSDRDILNILYDVTGGASWTNNDNWVTDAPLGEWFGIMVDGEGRVVNLHLTGNNLTGPIPPELGKLASLTWLDLRFNDLTGPIPAELGNLSQLGTLRLETNHLTGPIPPELGDLANLELLWLGANDLEGPIPAELGTLANLGALWLEANNLTGPIPPELGNLASLRWLDLRLNELTGPIPAELGDLANLELLWLEANDLTGPIPAELGSLTRLMQLHLDRNALTGPIPPDLGGLSMLVELLLDNNDLSGSVPPELAALTSLRALVLSNNEALGGALPHDLAALGALETLVAGGTGLCAPMDPTVLAWLGGIRKRRIAMCAEAEPAAAYLTQAVQSLKFPVPLIAGEKALLRVFPTAARTTSAGIPPVRARFFIDDRETHVANVSGTSGPIPTEVSEGNLSTSADVEIPGSVVRPGLEMVIEVDPEGTLDPGLGVTGRIPERGRLAVDVEVMPTLELTMIPFLWSPQPDSLVLDLVEAMADDPDGHELLRMTRDLLPIREFLPTAHEPVITSHNNSYTLLFATEAIRVLEGERGHYLGTITGEFRGVGGLALGVGSRTSFAKIDRGEQSESVIAHELGHNMGLQHPAGCRAGNPDYAYPHANGSTGAWGYDYEAERLVPPTARDLMSYCSFEYEWISDYHFSNALRYRLEDEGQSDASVAGAPQQSLLLWGGVAADSVPFLEPAFVVEARPVLPQVDGPYWLSGRAADGSELFSFSTGMTEVIDGDGSSSFAFVLPVGPDWEDNLSSITLLGPRGSVTLDTDSDLPALILRNPLNGQVRGILRDLRGSASTLADAVATLSPEPGLEVLFSRGIPDAEAWIPQERE